MKKIYVTILLIAVALFISCDEKKAKDEITKAIEKSENETQNVADNKTPKPKGSGTLTNTKGEAGSKPEGSGTPTNTGSEDAGGEEGEEAEGETESEEPEKTPPPPLTKPDLSSERAPWDILIVFPKVAGHTYKLKEAVRGVSLTVLDETTMQITATQSVQNVIIVATVDGKTTESEPIEFTRIPGNTLSFANKAIETKLKKSGQSKLTQPIRVHVASATVDNRHVTYSITPTGRGGTIDSGSGEVTLTGRAENVVFTITAELPQTEKYTRATASYTLTVTQGSGAPTNTGSEDAGGDTPPPLTKPDLSSEREAWSTLITFPKVLGHTYRLKEEKTGVTLNKNAINAIRVIATQSAQNVIIVATLDGRTIESNPIEFTRIPGNTLSFTTTGRIEDPNAIANLTETATKSGTVAGDTRDITYSVSPTGQGVTIHSGSGRITIALDATEGDYIITAELPQDEKYTKATATYTLTLSKE